MGTIDLLHPEELFDKAARGLATAEEQKLCDAHLAACATCRFERQVRADFDAVSVAGVNVDALVAGALSGAATTSTELPRRRVGPLLVAAAVALMGFGSFAAVMQFTGVLPRLLQQLSPQPAPVEPPAPAPRRSHVAPQVEAPVVEPVVAPEPVAETTPPPPTTVVIVERKHVAAPRPVAPVAAPTPDPPPAPVVPAEPDALTLFSRATQERVRGETSEAIRDFRVVVARFPGGREAALSNAALGRLLLDRGEAASALEALDAYLATSDQVLREDVQGTRALALQALGRADDERAAWEAMLRDYPAGVFAPRAKVRLEALSP
jgi:hypothetical protein